MLLPGRKKKNKPSVESGKTLLAELNRRMHPSSGPDVLQLAALLLASFALAIWGQSATVIERDLNVSGLTVGFVGGKAIKRLRKD